MDYTVTKSSEINIIRDLNNAEFAYFLKKIFKCILILIAFELKLIKHRIMLKTKAF